VRLVTQLYVVTPPEELLEPPPDDPPPEPLPPEPLDIAASSFASSLASSLAIASGSLSVLASGPLLAPVGPSSPIGFDELDEPPPDEELPEDDPLEAPLDEPGLLKSPSLDAEPPFAQAPASADATTTVLHHPLRKPLRKPPLERPVACIEAPFSQLCLFLSPRHTLQGSEAAARLKEFERVVNRRRRTAACPCSERTNQKPL
jgi:hypothetical protein